MEKQFNRLNNPEYMELVDFLVKKATNLKEVLNIKGLIREFKRQSNSPMSYEGLRKRVDHFRHSIHKLSHLDTETKVKLIFGLSAPVDQELLEELKNDAEVKVDSFNRIIHYRKNDGGLELNGKPKSIYGGTMEPATSIDQILEFIAEKVQEKSGILCNAKICKQFKAMTDNYRASDTLEKRFRLARNYIYESELFDENMKIRMLFATSAVIPDYILKELRKDAIVVVDQLNRIKEYQSNDGSLYLNREKSLRGKRGINRILDNPVDIQNSDEKGNVEEQHGDSSDDSDGEGTSDGMTRGRILSRKRFSDASLFNNQDDISYDEKRVKLESFDDPLNDDTSRALTEEFVVSKYGEMLLDVKLEEPEVEKHTSLALILESLRDFINILDLPILSDLQKKIEAKIEECKGKMISNTGIYYSLELCLLSVNKNWKIHESVEPFSLESFLSPFRHAVVHMKCPSLVDFQEKLKRIIGELRVKNKFIPVTAIRSALEGVIYNIIHS